CRFRDDTDGMAAAIEHLEDAPHDLVFALDRLVGIGIRADRYGAWDVTGGRQLAFEQLRRIRLGEELGFEIESGRQAEIGVGRPREAVDAAVLATAIRIDRSIERNIR